MHVTNKQATQTYSECHAHMRAARCQRSVPARCLPRKHTLGTLSTNRSLAALTPPHPLPTAAPPHALNTPTHQQPTAKHPYPLYTSFRILLASGHPALLAAHLLTPLYRMHGSSLPNTTRQVDVTTEDTGISLAGIGARAVIGGSSMDWYKSSAGGVAYTGGNFTVRTFPLEHLAEDPISQRLSLDGAGGQMHSWGGLLLCWPMPVGNLSAGRAAAACPRVTRLSVGLGNMFIVIGL